MYLTQRETLCDLKEMQARDAAEKKKTEDERAAWKEVVADAEIRNRE